MFSLVQFDDEKYFITATKFIGNLQNEHCLVKYKGAKYRAVRIRTSDSKNELNLVQKSLESKLSVVVERSVVESNSPDVRQKATDVESNSPDIVQKATDVESNSPDAMQKVTDVALEISHANVSYQLHGMGCSTPVDGEVPPSRDQLTLSNITPGNCSAASSAAPSGCTDIFNDIGDDWLRNSYEAQKLEDIQLRDINGNYGKGNRNRKNNNEQHNEVQEGYDSEIQDNEQENGTKADDVERDNEVGREETEVGGYCEHNQKPRLDNVQNEEGCECEIPNNEQENDTKADDIERNNEVGQEETEVGGYSEHNQKERLENVQNEEGCEREIPNNEQENDTKADDIERNNEVGQEETEVGGYSEHNPKERLENVQNEEGCEREIPNNEQENDTKADDIERNNEVGREETEVGGYSEDNQKERLDNVQNEEGCEREIPNNEQENDTKADDIERNNEVGREETEVGGNSKHNQMERLDSMQDKESVDGVSSDDANEFDNETEFQNEIEDNVIEETSADNTAEDSNYIPGSSLSNVTSDISQINATQILPQSFAAGSSIDTRLVNVPPSKTNTTRTPKKYFCPFCKKLQTKFARHLELKHKTEVDVKRFMKFPKKNYERAKIIETIRKHGNFLHNTDSDLNTGILITCRQRQPKYDRDVQDYVCCSSCKGFFSKQTLRLHFKKCNTTHKKGVRDILVMGRRLTGYMHEAACETLRRTIVPVMRDDDITRSFQYDELLILFANKLCDKHSSPHQHDMVRAHIRLLARFKSAVKDINQNITDFASIFHPTFYDSVVAAVRICAKMDTNTHMLKTPAVASTLGTLLKKCLKLRMAECIKKQNYEGKQNAKDFLVLFEDDFAISISKKVVDAQTKQKREKQIILPSKEDIRKLYNYLTKNCEASLKILDTRFKLSAWKTLTESTLISIQIFNRRRAGEIERLLITDFDNRTQLDENVDPDLYRQLSVQSRDFAKQFARLAIKGKLGRTVPVILNPLNLSCFKTIFKYRTQAGVHADNEFIFSVPTRDPTKKKYLRACELMRKFSYACGASVPSSLTGTGLRKHIATYFAMEGLGETEVADLANFMGHNQQIHKDIYRVPVPIREVVHVSRLLQQAISKGDEEEDEDDGADSEAAEEPIAQIASKQILRTCVKKSTNTINNSNTSSEGGNSSDTDTDEESITKRRSTSPYEKTKRTRWSSQEKSAVQSFFGDPTTLKKLPSLTKCQKAIRECKALKNRQPDVLKTWIDNQRKALSRRRVSIRQ